MDSEVIRVRVYPHFVAGHYVEVTKGREVIGSCYSACRAEAVHFAVLETRAYFQWVRDAQ